MTGGGAGHSNQHHGSHASPSSPSSSSSGNPTVTINASKLDTVEDANGTELKTVASDEEWLVIDSSSKDGREEDLLAPSEHQDGRHLTPASPSPSDSVVVMEAGNEAVDGVLGGSKRKTSGNSLSPALGPRSKSLSGTRSPRALRPSSPSNNLQRRASGRGARPVNLEVQQQNGSRHRSGSPSRLRTESPSRASSSPSTKSSLRTKKSSNSGTSSPIQADTPPPNRAQSQPSSQAAVVNGTSAENGKSDESGGGQAFAAKIRDTLRISRPKRKKDKKKKGMAYSVDPVKYSAVEITSKYQDPFETSYAENGEEKGGHGHDFQPASIPHNKPEYCDHCGDMAWGLYRQVLKCSSKCVCVCIRVCVCLCMCVCVCACAHLSVHVCGK